jgi:predicted nucleotidyltransferase
MEEHIKERPKKSILPEDEQKEILEKVKEFVLDDLLPNPKINKIILFGSLVKGTFGKYEKTYKNRIYSDIDILVMVEDDFEVQDEWKSHFSCGLYDVYNVHELDGKIPIQYLVCTKKSYEKEENQEEAEKWGVPLLLNKSKHNYIILYENSS